MFEIGSNILISFFLFRKVCHQLERCTHVHAQSSTPWEPLILPIMDKICDYSGKPGSSIVKMLYCQKTTFWIQALHAELLLKTPVSFHKRSFTSLVHTITFGRRGFASMHVGFLYVGPERALSLCASSGIDTWMTYIATKVKICRLLYNSWTLFWVKEIFLAYYPPLKEWKMPLALEMRWDTLRQ